MSVLLFLNTNFESDIAKTFHVTPLAFLLQPGSHFVIKPFGPKFWRTLIQGNGIVLPFPGAGTTQCTKCIWTSPEPTVRSSRTSPVQDDDDDATTPSTSRSETYCSFHITQLITKLQRSQANFTVCFGPVGFCV